MLNERLCSRFAVILVMTYKEQKPNCIALVDEHHRETATNVLSKHSLNGMLLHDPILAMSELCLMYQLSLQDVAWKDSHPEISFILIQVERTEPINQLIHAIQKYYPHVSLLELREGKLSPIELDDAVYHRFEAQSFKLGNYLIKKKFNNMIKLSSAVFCGNGYHLNYFKEFIN